MRYLIVAALVLAALYGLARLVAGMNPRALANLVRFVALLVIAAGAFLGITGRVSLAIPLIALGVGVLRFGRGGQAAGGSGSQGGVSSVRGRFVTATLDRDSGRLSGQVTDGKYAGKELDALAEAELRELLAEAAADSDSVALVEAYLDRRFPAWREHVEEDAGPGAGGAANAGSMTDEEAYQILGLPAGAGEAEIRAAHRRLLKGVHPDQGGSTFLAARINQARDRLLDRHRPHS